MPTRRRDMLLIVLLAGAAVRLALMPFGSFASDAAVASYWASHLMAEPFSDFYADPGLVDHLPGDLWIFWATAKAHQLLMDNLHIIDIPLAVWQKLVPGFADVGIGLLLFLLGRRLAGPGVGVLAAAFFMFNPGPIFLTSIWRAWDAVSTLFVLIALWLLLRGNPEWSLPTLAYAVLIKPTFAALAPLLALAFAHRYLLPHARWAGWVQASEPVEPLGRSLRRALVAVAASAAVAVLVLQPFGIAVPPLPGRWTLSERLRYSLDVYPFATAGAFNLWALWGLRTPERLRLDDLPVLFGLSYQTAGALLLAVAYAAVLFLYWRRNSDKALLWAALAITLALFVLPTRVHERYLFPAVVFAALAAAVAPRLRWVCAVMSLTYSANLYWVYAFYNPAPVFPALYASNLFSAAASLLNLGLLLYVLFRALPALQRPAWATEPHPAQDQRFVVRSAAGMRSE